MLKIKKLVLNMLCLKYASRYFKEAVTYTGLKFQREEQAGNINVEFFPYRWYIKTWRWVEAASE